jgi:hypothetical protein
MFLKAPWDINGVNRLARSDARNEATRSRKWLGFPAPRFVQKPDGIRPLVGARDGLRLRRPPSGLGHLVAPPVSVPAVRAESYRLPRRWLP